MKMQGCRRVGRFFCFAILFALGFAMRANAAGAGGNSPKTTQVQDIVYRADGTRATGWIVIAWPAFVTADGAAVAAGSKSVQLGSDGSFSVALAPNAGGIPAGAYYAVTVKLDGGTTSKESWLVPATSPATLASVRASTVPSTMALQALTTDWANANLVNVSAAQQIAGIKSFAVSPNGPDPVGERDLATKRYVDANSGTGQNVAKTNAANTWTQPQTFPSAVMTDTKQYPITAFGAVAGQDATASMNSVNAMVPAGSTGTMILPPGQWNRTTTLDTSSSGFLKVAGAGDGYAQFQSVLSSTPSGADCIADSSHVYPYTHSIYLSGFRLECGPGAVDGIHWTNMGNMLGAIDGVTVMGAGYQRFAGSGAAFHLQNSYTTSASRLYSSGGTYGLFLDSSNEARVRDSEFTQAGIASVGGSGVAHDISADYSWVKSPSGGGVAAIYMQNAQMNTFRGYFESGSGTFQNHVLASLSPQTISQDLSHVWASDTANQCIDLGYNNVCPKGQGYYGSWHGVGYTNLFPNSSATGPVTGIGLTYSGFNASQDCSGGSAQSARGCAYKLVTTGTGNAYFGFSSFAMNANHTYLLRGLVWADAAYYRDNPAGNPGGLSVNLNPPGGGGFPSNNTGNYIDTVPREVCLISQSPASGAGQAYFQFVNSTASGIAMWVTDIVLADVTNIHGTNLCELPYVETFGTGTAHYNSVANVIVPATVIGTGTTIGEDPVSPGVMTLGTVASGNTNGTASIGNAANPIATISAAGISALKGNSAAVPSDFITGATSLSPITGLSFTLPATAYSGNIIARWGIRRPMARRR